VKSGDSLLKVLSDYAIEDYGGEWDGDCNGEFNETKKTLAVGSEKTNEWFDLLVNNKITVTKNFEDKNGECQANETISTETTVLKFNGEAYKNE
jgi:hypothetical protein